MGKASALTAALNSSQSPDKASSTATSNSSSVSSAFPCLYQRNSGADDAFEVDLDLEKLRLSNTPKLNRAPTSVRRRSLDASQDEGQRWEKLGSADLISRFMSPGSLGSSLAQSLPKPMATSLRRSIALDSPSPSPHINSFKDILPEQLSARNGEGRRLRRRVLKGTVLVCIVAGYHGKRFIYERAKELGIRFVIVDSEKSWAKELAEEGIISKFIDMDFSDEGAVFDKCLNIIRKVETEYGQVDGVISFWELSQPLVARLAEQLSLPGNPPDAVDNARDKQRTRDVMEAAGLPTPKNMPVSMPEDLQEAAKVVGFPAVLKPTSGAASVGVIKVDSLKDLDRVYRRVCKEVSSITETSDGRWQTAGDAPDPDPEAAIIVEENTGAKFVAQTFIMEQYLDGPEVDVDLVMSGGEAVYGAITDNWPTVEPMVPRHDVDIAHISIHQSLGTSTIGCGTFEKICVGQGGLSDEKGIGYFNETGSNCPSTLPHEQQKELCDLAVAAAKCLGFQMGVLHTELKYTSHGPQLIEVNARMGGGPVHLMNQLVWGVDLVEEQMLASAGIPSRPYISKRPNHFVAEYSVNSKHTGIIKNLDFLKEWQDDGDVVYCRPLVEAGEKVVAIEDGMPTWIYEVLVTRPNIDNAIKFVKDIEKAIEPYIPIEPRKSKENPEAPDLPQEQ